MGRRTMSDEMLSAALKTVRVRVPESLADLADLRAEVRAADAALGTSLRTVALERTGQHDRRAGGGAR